MGFLFFGELLSVDCFWNFFLVLPVLRVEFLNDGYGFCIKGMGTFWNECFDYWFLFFGCGLLVSLFFLHFLV